MLFSKLPSTIYYLQHGEEMAIQPKRSRAAAELEVRPGRSREDQLAVVVATLLDDQKSEALDSIKTIFANCISEIRAWESEAEARRILTDNDNNEGESPRRPSTSILVHFYLSLM